MTDTVFINSGIKYQFWGAIFSLFFLDADLVSWQKSSLSILV